MALSNIEFNLIKNIRLRYLGEKNEKFMGWLLQKKNIQLVDYFSFPPLPFPFSKANWPWGFGEFWKFSPWLMSFYNLIWLQGLSVCGLWASRIQIPQYDVSASLPLPVTIKKFVMLLSDEFRWGGGAHTRPVPLFEAQVTHLK